MVERERERERDSKGGGNERKSLIQIYMARNISRLKLVLVHVSLKESSEIVALTKYNNKDKSLLKSNH